MDLRHASLITDGVKTLRLCFFFFFSSRRRHTRYIGDWSSDVCSSDLDQGAAFPADDRPEPDPRDHWAFRAPVRPAAPMIELPGGTNPVDAFLAAEWKKQIGRASCRERV